MSESIPSSQLSDLTVATAKRPNRMKDMQDKRRERLQATRMANVRAATMGDPEEGGELVVAKPYSIGSWGKRSKGYHKTIYRRYKTSKKSKRSHKSMPKKRSYRKKTSRRKSSPFYYDKVLGQKVLRPNVLRSWQKLGNEYNIWKPEEIAPIDSLEKAAALKFGLSASSATDEQLLNRRLHGYKGSGAYSLGKMWRKSGLGKTVAGSARSLIRAGTSKALGAMSGMGLYGGQGAYMANQLISGGRMASSGSFANDETDTITITDCEYVKDIYAPTIAAGTSSFANQTIDANPGLTAFAPNLAQIASNFLECEWKQLVFELRPVISESNVNNGLTGAAMMVFNYDPQNGNPYDNKEDVMQAHGSVSGRIVDGLKCGVECDPDKVRETEYFIRTGPVPFGRNTDDFDIGQLVIATNNIPSAFSNQQIYELWVYYTVDLRKRKAGAMRLNNQQKDIFVCSGDVTQANFPQNQFIGGVGGVCASQQNNIGGLLTSPGQSRFDYTFPPDFNGIVEFRLLVEGAAMGYTAPPSVTFPTGCVTLSTIADMYGGVNVVGGDSPNYIVYNNGTTQYLTIFHLRVRSVVGGLANTVRLDTTMNAGSVTQWQFDVTEYTANHFTSPTIPRPRLVNVSDGSVVVPA